MSVNFNVVLYSNKINLTFVCKSKDISVLAGLRLGKVADFNVISARDVFVLASLSIDAAVNAFFYEVRSK